MAKRTKKTTEKPKRESEETFHGPTSDLVPKSYNEIYRKNKLRQIDPDEPVDYGKLPEFSTERYWILLTPALTSKNYANPSRLIQI